MDFVIQEERSKAVKIKLPHNYKAITALWRVPVAPAAPASPCWPHEAQWAPTDSFGHTCEPLSGKPTGSSGEAGSSSSAGLEMTGPRLQWRPTPPRACGDRGEKSHPTGTPYSSALLWWHQNTVQPPLAMLLFLAVPGPCYCLGFPLVVGGWGLRSQHWVSLVVVASCPEP